MIVVLASWLGEAAQWAEDRADDGFDYLAGFGQCGLLIAVLAGILALVAAGPVRLPTVRGWARAYTTSPKAAPRSRDSRKELDRKRRRHWRMRVVDWFYGGEIKLETFSAPEGTADAESFAAVVQDALGASSAAVDAGVDVMVSTTETDVLTDIADSLKDLPHGKVAQALLKLGRKALPRDAFFLNGRLLPRADTGAGVTLALSTRRGRVRYTTTLWEETYMAQRRPGGSAVSEPTASKQADSDKLAAPDEIADESSSFPYELAIAGAAWAEYRISQHRRDQRLGLLRTTDWQSYAYLQTGLARQRTAGALAAQPLFARAVDRDPANLVAALNLAVTEIREKDFDRAIPRLGTIRTNKAGEDDHPNNAGLLDRDPVWFTASYQLAAAELMRYREQASEEQAETFPAETQDTARELCLATEEALSELEQRLAPCQNAQRQSDARAGAAANDELEQRLEERDRFLRKIEGPSLVLLASILASEGLVSLTPTCSPDMNRGSLISALKDRMPPRSKANGCQWLTPGEIIDGYLRRHVALDSRTHYNLACYYAEQGQRKGRKDGRADYDKALEELRSAVEPQDLTDWSQSDPSLAPLRTHRKKEFEEIIGKTAVEPWPERLLARIGGGA